MGMVIQILFGLSIILGLIFLISTRNIIHAAWALCLVLISLAGIYVILMAELLAVVQIMLYAGGVIILLAFGVMMTHRMRGQKVQTEHRNVWLGALVSLGVLAVLMRLFSTIGFESGMLKDQNQMEVIGLSFLTEHLVAFELIAFILLVALVGAAYLAKNAAND
jgi:NADH-quinone oxidoreductase subunit J